jgi:hypothetical protein
MAIVKRYYLAFGGKESRCNTEYPSTIGRGGSKLGPTPDKPPFFVETLAIREANSNSLPEHRLSRLYLIALEISRFRIFRRQF